MRLHVDVWDGVVLQGYPLRKTLRSYLREGVGVHEFLIASDRGPSTDSPYNVGTFPGAVFANRIPPELASFVDAEMQSLIARGQCGLRVLLSLDGSFACLLYTSPSPRD